MKQYKEIDDVDNLVHQMNKYLEDYNDVSKTKMDLVLFVFAVEHISRIARVLSMPEETCYLLVLGKWEAKFVALSCLYVRL